MVRSEEFHHRREPNGADGGPLRRRHSDFESSRAVDATQCGGGDDDDVYDEAIPFSATTRHPSSEWNLISGAGDQNDPSNNIGGSNEGTLSSSSSVIADPLHANGLLSPSNNTGGTTSGGGNGSGGSLDDKRLRRQIANCNERRRMQSINAGFQALRQLLPCKEGEKMSKAAILQHTAEFIHALQQEKNRLAANNEISAQFKRRRVDNPSYTGDDQMDTNEEHGSGSSRERGGQVGELPMDVLECLKVIDELRRELLHEQQLRKVYEKEVVEMKNKTAATATTVTNVMTSGNGIPATTFNGHELTTENNADGYSKIISTAQKISPLSQSSAFTAISSLQDALNSPLISTASPNTVFSATTPNSTATFERGANDTTNCGGTYASHIMIQNTNSAPITDETTRGSLSTITLTLPSDVISQLGQAAMTGGNGRLSQPSHIMVDAASAGQFVTLNAGHHQASNNSPLQVKTSVSGPSTLLSNTVGLTSTSAATFPSYASSGNLLIQVNQNGLLTGSKPYTSLSELAAYSQGQITAPQQPQQQQLQQSWDSPKIIIQSGQDTSIMTGALACNNITTSVATLDSQFNVVHHSSGTSTTAPVTTTSSTAAAVAAAQNASLSQRNLQAILDAIRHIEGGTIASMGNNTTSSSPRSQASDVLVR